MTTTPSNKSNASRISVFLYGLGCYALFLVTFVYTIGFVGGIVVPKSINTGAVGPIVAAIVINSLLLGLFAVQHAVMARPWFKERWTKIVPEPIERSTYVLATCLALLLMCWQWRPMPEVVWSVDSATARTILHGLFVGGWVLVLYASFCIDHFDLFGLRQVVLYARGLEYTSPGFATPMLYKLVRNPLMLGFLIAFWSAPVMTQGRLLFAVVTTVYIFVGINMEERDLLRALGEGYRSYRQRTPMVFPFPRRAAPAADAPTA